VQDLKLILLQIGPEDAHLILLLAFFPVSPFSGSVFFRMLCGVKSKNKQTRKD
jgi:hypothetical protein